MVEIRVHGRGGQGGVTLAKLVATSHFLKGKSVQAFGLYAAERSGAPIQAFCRIADEPITNRNLIYEPDHVIVLDPTLAGPAILAGLRPGGFILINTPAAPGDLAADYPEHRIATVDATSIARKYQLGTASVPIVNTALAGAVCRIFEAPLDDAIAALDHLGFGGGNVDAARAAFESVSIGDPPRAPSTKEAAGSTRASAVAPKAPGPSILQEEKAPPPAIRTGSWASERPHRQQSVPPCNHVCPAGNDVQGFLHALAKDETDRALEILLRTTPFPGVCGRVCPAPCMASCNRISLDGAVNVRELERFAADNGTAKPPRPSAHRDERVAVVGSGPGGLSAAYQLALLGYRVTVFEAGPELGGLLRTGIPGFRLPRDVVESEIGRVIEAGVESRTCHRLGREELLSLARDHDAVLVATGLQEARSLRLGLGGRTSPVVQGIDFLDRVQEEEVRVDGEDVVVVGGGNTAVDAARSARRLGAASVRIVYRRSREEMPAIAEEIGEAFDEGVVLELLTQPVSLGRQCEGGKHALVCRRMTLGEPDETGRRRPVEVAGSEFEIPCDRVILALGQSPDVSVFPEGTEVHEGDRLLGLIETPVFAVGDFATQEGTVAGAIGSGRRAALHVHESLSGETIPTSEHAAARRDVEVWRDEVVRPESMKLHVFERHARDEGGTIDSGRRVGTFDEVHSGLRDAHEAKRCLSCGVCNECDVCITYCPEGVLKRVGHEFVFDYSFCKGCGVCVTECPRNVVFMSHL